jgi:2-amino-4-hydroxy-6-hydroxymethyldihydropteridine diphosphokinase
METDTLTIPHPLLHQRKFALAPLEEIAPELVHPVKGKTIRELLREVLQ